MVRVMANRLPSITIITPVYNQAKYLEESIQSVLAQNYPLIEYIVLDGGSTDGTVDILRKYSDKITWYSRKDKGQADALNKGFGIAKGRIVGYLCADDKYTKGTLRTVGEYFAKHPQDVLVTGDYQVINSEGKSVFSIERHYKKLLWKFNSHNMFLFANYVNEPSTFWRRSLFEEFGAFDTELDYVFDYEWWLRVNKKYPIKIINSVLSNFRIHNESKSGVRFRQAFANDLLAAKRHTKNRTLLAFKQLHNRIIVMLYSFLRY